MSPDTILYHNGRPTAARQIADELQILAVSQPWIDAYIRSCQPATFADEPPGETVIGERGAVYRRTKSGGLVWVSAAPERTKGVSGEPAEGGGKGAGGAPGEGATASSPKAAAQILGIGTPKDAAEHVKNMAERLGNNIATVSSRTDRLHQYPDDEDEHGNKVGPIATAINRVTAGKSSLVEEALGGMVRGMKATATKAWIGSTKLADVAGGKLAELCGGFAGDLVGGAVRAMGSKVTSRIAERVGEDHKNRLTKNYGEGLANLVMASGHMATGLVTGSAIAVGLGGILTGDLSGQVGLGIAAAAVGLNALARHTTLGQNIASWPGEAAAYALTSIPTVTGKLARGSLAVTKWAGGKAAKAVGFADDMLTPDNFPGLKKAISKKDLQKLIVDTHTDITAKVIAGWLKDPTISKGLAALAVAFKNDPDLFKKFQAAEFAASGTLMYRGIATPYHVVRAELAALGITGRRLDDEIASLASSAGLA